FLGERPGVLSEKACGTAVADPQVGVCWRHGSDRECVRRLRSAGRKWWLHAATWRLWAARYARSTSSTGRALRGAVRACARGAIRLRARHGVAVLRQAEAGGWAVAVVDAGRGSDLCGAHRDRDCPAGESAVLRRRTLGVHRRHPDTHGAGSGW